MITVSVISVSGAAPPRPLAASFDETGGTIGRAEGNQLILPDPERSVSRVHARVVFRNGRYAIVDCGSNPIVLNQRTLGEGAEAWINPGDRIQIGAYLLAVSAAQAQPFADVGGAAMPPTARAASSPSPASADPFAAFGLSPSPAPSPSPAAPSARPAGGSAQGGIPDDWDPFAAPAADKSRESARAAGGRNDLGLDLGAGAPPPLIEAAPGAGGSSSLDALFGLGGAPAGADPLAGSVLAAPIAQPNMAGDADPMRALGMVTPASAPSVSDNFSDLNRPFVAPPAAAPAKPAMAAPAGKPTAAPAAAPPTPASPQVKSAPPAQSPPPMQSPPTAAATPASQALPEAPVAGTVLSWVDSPGRSSTVIRGSAVPAPAPSAPAASPVAASSKPMQGVEALRAAFLKGLGSDVDLPPLSPAFMQLLGELMRESTQGAIDLLQARSALKREVRAEDATIIQVRENNGLKFSPDVDVGLRHLLGPPVRGFMAPVPSVRNAFDDLRAHQLAFLAGMRAALEGVLKRFAPDALEPKLAGGSGLAQLVPAIRKARLWELFQGLYTQISREAEDDFHSLFGKEFLRAYEEQLERISKGGER